jgi:hypothetical protein
MEKHVTLVAALQIGFGILGVFIGFIAVVVLVGSGLLSDDPEAMTILAAVAIFSGMFFFILSIPSIIGGVGLLKYRPWARMLVLIISCLDLINIPIGTAIAIYSFWVLLNDETTELFRKGGPANQPV